MLAPYKPYNKTYSASLRFHLNEEKDLQVLFEKYHRLLKLVLSTFCANIAQHYLYIEIYELSFRCFLQRAHAYFVMRRQ